MNQLKSKCLILSRINYREADRIVVALTPDYGKIRLIAKGSRTLKSKLAGGIELFCVNDISFIRGRGEIATIVSSRSDKNYGNILKDIERVMLGYEILKIIDRTTEDEVESDFYYLLESAIEGLNDPDTPVLVIRFWFLARLIALSGHAPNLIAESDGRPLAINSKFGFDYDLMSFFSQSRGTYDANNIKFLRLALSLGKPQALGRVEGSDQQSVKLMPLINMMRSTHLYG